MKDDKPADSTAEKNAGKPEKTDEHGSTAEQPTNDTEEEGDEDDTPSSSASTDAPSTPTADVSRSPALKAVEPPEPVKTPTPLSPRAEPFAPAPKLEDLIAQAVKAHAQPKKKEDDAPASDKGKQPEAQTTTQKAPPVTPKTQKHINIPPSKGAHSVAAKVEAAVKAGASVIPTVLQVSDMHWFTSDADLIEAATAAGVEVTFKDVTFLEHKCNGKSKG